MKPNQNQGQWQWLSGFFHHLNRKLKMKKKKKKQGKTKHMLGEEHIPILRKHRKRKAIDYQGEQQGNKKMNMTKLESPILKKHGKRKAIELSSSSSYQEQQGNKKTKNMNMTTIEVSSSISYREEQGNKKMMMMIPPESSNHSLILKNISRPPIKDNNNKTIHDLPEEILAVILTRLPLKYLLRCRCVQKSWFSLVISPNFITIHLNHQKVMNTTHSHHHPKFLFIQNTFSDRLTIRFDDIQCEEYYKLKFHPDLPRSVWLAQSYGLICVTPMFDSYLGYKPNIYLWNPLVQKYKALPHSPLSSFSSGQETRWTALAFGFVPQDNDYVVVHIVKPPLLSAPDPHSVMIGVYSLNTNSWKITSQDNVFVSGISEYCHIFVDGVAYWLGKNPQMRSQIIMCFDTKTGILREISLPDWVENQVYDSSLVIHPFGQSIAYFVENRKLNHLDMWVLKGDPENEFSWEKKMSATVSEDFRVEVLGLRNNGEPILFKLFNFVSYNLDNHEANDFVDSWDRWGHFSFYEKNFAPPFAITPFVESLVLLN